MDIKTFYKTQREIAEVINRLIDDYWGNTLCETEMINILNNLYNNNSSKIFKNDGYTTIMKQQCGKRRLEVVSKILDLNNE